MPVNGYFSGRGRQQLRKSFCLIITPSKLLKHIAYGRFSQLDSGIGEPIIAGEEEMRYSANRTETIRSVNHSADPYSSGIIVLAEGLEKQLSYLSCAAFEQIISTELMV